MSVRCFALDIDGTVTDRDGRLDLEAAGMLRRLCDLGYYVVFVSGRSIWEVSALTSYLGTTKVSVGENGGVVATLPFEILLLGDGSVSLLAYDLLSKSVGGVELKPTMPRFTEVVLKRGFPLEEGRRALVETGLPVRLIDSGFAYHITNSRVNKGRGLKVALRRLELKPSEVVAIGDSDTDIPMFQLCGSSIALGNATEEAKRNAAYTVESPMGDGLIEAIRLTFRRIMKREMVEV